MEICVSIEQIWCAGHAHYCFYSVATELQGQALTVNFRLYYLLKYRYTSCTRPRLHRLENCCVSRAVARGAQGVQLNPPSKLMIFMTIVMPWKN